MNNDTIIINKDMPPNYRKHWYALSTKNSVGGEWKCDSFPELPEEIKAQGYYMRFLADLWLYVAKEEIFVAEGATVISGYKLTTDERNGEECGEWVEECLEFIRHYDYAYTITKSTPGDFLYIGVGDTPEEAITMALQSLEDELQEKVEQRVHNKEAIGSQNLASHT